MYIKKGPPSIWLTINPADMQDPITQVLCGQDLDLDNFNALDHELSNSSVMSDPYASATFFHLTIRALLVELLHLLTKEKEKQAFLE